MTKLCPRGKAAAKRKFRVYPSAYANAYASKICAGKIKDPSGVKRKDFRGRKGAAMGGPMSTEIGRQFKIQKMMGTGAAKKSLKNLKDQLAEIRRDRAKVKKGKEDAKPPKDPRRPDMMRPKNPRLLQSEIYKLERRPSRTRKKFKTIDKIIQEQTRSPKDPRTNRAGGGLMEATARLKRQGLKGGGICKKGMNRQAVGKNS